MEEIELKKYLKAYLENKLDFENYERFFDSIAQVESSTLSKWINEALESDIEIDENSFIGSRPNFIALQNKINEQILKDYTSKPSTNYRKLILHLTAYAAAVCVIIGGAHYIISSRNNHTQEFTFENNLSYNIKAYLPDSSQVILFPNSKIKYSFNQHAQSREITHTEGKVLYKVKKSNQAFNVNYKQYITHALGTQFIVDASDMMHTTVKLLEGKIRIYHNQRPQQNIFLVGQGEAMINILQKSIDKNPISEKESKAINTIYQSKIKDNNVTVYGNIQWSSKILEINQLKAADIFQLLEQIYDVTIVAENRELLENKFTGSINRSESLEEFLSNYCELNGCEFVSKNHVIEIIPIQRKEAPQ